MDAAVCDTNAGGPAGSTGVTSEGKHTSLWQARVPVGQLEKAIPTGTEPKVLNTKSQVPKKNGTRPTGGLMRRNAGRAGERQAGATGNQHGKVAGGGGEPNSNWKLSFKYNLYPKSGQE